MQTAQRLLLVAFILFAAFTALQQVQYGMICGRSEEEDQQEDPKAKACQKRALISAIGAAVSLAASILIGVLLKR